jgi:DinB family protein
MTSLTSSIGGILVRELSTLKQEIEAYPGDADLWRVVPGISNPGGNLALHLAGNLQHFVGAILGGTSYVRNRDAEFSARGLSKAELVAEVSAAISAVEDTFRRLGPSDMAAEYPEPIAKVRLNTGDFMIHLASHLAYHLGQVDYHRRIVTGRPATVGAVSPTRLASARQVE